MTKKKKLTKEQRRQMVLDELYGESCDDRFAFIAGYTSGGAPYGTTWEEMGIDPLLPFSEKVSLLGSGEFDLLVKNIPKENEEEKEESLQLQVIPETFSICQVENYRGIDIDQPFVFTGRTDEEKSLVCPVSMVPESTLDRSDWRSCLLFLPKQRLASSRFQPITQITCWSKTRITGKRLKHWTVPDTGYWTAEVNYS